MHPPFQKTYPSATSAGAGRVQGRQFSVIQRRTDAHECSCGTLDQKKKKKTQLTQIISTLMSADLVLTSNTEEFDLQLYFLNYSQLVQHARAQRHTFMNLEK